MSGKSTPSAALELVCMSIANTAYLLAQTQIPYDERTKKDENGKEVKAVPSIESVRSFVPFIGGFDTYFYPLLRDASGNMIYQPDIGIERAKYIWGPSNDAAEYQHRIHQNRAHKTVDLMVNFKEELKTKESGVLLDRMIAARQHEAADPSFVMLPPAIPEKLHQPTLEKLDPAKEFIADRAAFDLFMVHSALVNCNQTKFDWTRRSRFVTTGGEPLVAKARDELMDIYENGVTLYEEGQAVEKSVAENDHFEYSVFDLMNGQRVSNDRKRALPVVEYERAMRYVPAAQSWFKWVQVLGAEVEFDTNIEQTIRKAQDRVAQARETRAQGTVVRTVAAKTA
jgi:hypothetical protein